MNKELNLLGLATRAGKVINGEPLTLDGIKRKSVKLVYLASDAGNSTKKRIRDKTTTQSIPLIEDYTNHELSQSTGAYNRVVLGVTDDGFKKKLLELNEKGT